MTYQHYLLFIVFILAIAACTPQPTQVDLQIALIETRNAEIALATINAPTKTPIPIPTITSTSTPEPTPSPSPEPTATPNPTSPPTTDTTYDGQWLGYSDQNEVIEIVIENNGIKEITINYHIPNCPNSGFALKESAGAQYKHFVTDGAFTLTMGMENPENLTPEQLEVAQGMGMATDSIEVNGRFTNNNTIDGTLTITSPRCQETLEVTWTLGPPENFTPPPVSDALNALLPDTPLAEGHYLPDIGSQYFADYTAVLAQNDAWYLVQSFDSIYPIPAGWTTHGTGQEDAILFFSPEGIPDPENMLERADVGVIVSNCFGQYENSEALMTDLLNWTGADPHITNIQHTILNERQAYLFFNVILPDEEPQSRLFALTQFPNGDWFCAFDAGTSQANWNTYYPIIRTMVANWHFSQDGSRLGFDLPETLPN